MAKSKTLLLVLLAAVFVKAQENAQTRIPESLMECYRDHNMMQRDQRLPMTMNMLIELIRKVEMDPAGNNMDMRMLAISLIHRFRLDGIAKSPGVVSSPSIVPFSPKSFQFYKHRLILTNLIPGNAFTFPNNSLTVMERCSLHHMLSNTIEENERGDEGTVCNRLSQYRTQRLPRQVHSSKRNSRSIDGDDDDEVKTDVEIGVFPGNYDNEATNDVGISKCPVEDGVVHSTWGHVSAGTLIAGIAAGLQPMNIRVGDLSQRMNPENVPARNRQVVVDNKFAATLAGDLAEVSLRQGPLKNGQEIVIGAPGAWNATVNPKWYFVGKAKDNEFTDAEVRGGLDGLILATNIKDFQSKASTLKLSQLLDMYYSTRGVFSTTHRACNRQTLMPAVAPTETLKDQALGFSYALDIIMQVAGTISPDGFVEYSSKATDSLNSYIPRSLNDLSCTSISDDNIDVEVQTDIHIVLDNSWQHSFIYNQLAYLLNELNISPIGSNYTMMEAREANILINSSDSMAVYHMNYNASMHQSLPMGFDLPKVLENLNTHFQRKLRREREINSGGGQSSIVLMVINSATISDADLTFSIERLKSMTELIPDLRFLYLTAGPKDRFNDLVKNPAKDIFTIRDSDNRSPQLNDLISRVKDFQRRLINPKCGSEFSNNDVGTTQQPEFVAPTMINYYSIHPNYFFGLSGRGSLRVQGHGFGTLNVCTSRTVERPRKSNSTVSSEGIECQSVTTNTIEFSFSDLCKDRIYIHRCEPFFISVEGVSVPGTFRCTERRCRFPDSIKYTFSMTDFGCYSAANKFMINALALSLSVFLIFKNLIN